MNKYSFFAAMLISSLFASQAISANIIRVNAPITLSVVDKEPVFSLVLKDMPYAYVSKPYSFDLSNLVKWSGLSESQNPPKLVWSAVNLPNGLILSQSGMISGTMNKGGIASFSVIARHGEVESQVILSTKTLRLQQFSFITGYCNGQYGIGGCIGGAVYDSTVSPGGVNFFSIGYNGLVLMSLVANPEPKLVEFIKVEMLDGDGKLKYEVTYSGDLVYTYANAIGKENSPMDFQEASASKTMRISIGTYY